MGVGSALEAAASALTAFDTAIRVVSHNIANADTPGYSRRRVTLSTTTPPDQTRAGYIGRGVDVTSVERLAAENLVQDLHRKTADLSDFSTRLPVLQQLERLLSPESFSLSAVIDNFWNAWDDLANMPEGQAQRSALVATAQTLARYFHDIDSEMGYILTDLSDQVQAGLTKVNNLAASIAELNEQIRQAETVGLSADDYRDQRDGLLEEMSQYITNAYVEDDKGRVTVYLPNGKTLVQESDAYSLAWDDGDITWSGDGGTITDEITGGKLGAWLNLRDVVIPEYQANLDSLTQGIIREVNRLHAQGVGLEALTQTTGTYAVSDEDAALASAASGLTYYAEITDGYFNVLVYDANGDVDTNRIDVTTNTTLTDLAGQLDTITGLTASISQGRLALTRETGYSFAFGEVNSNALMALGVNTFMQGDSAGTIEVSSFIVDHHTHICAGLVDTQTGEIAPGDNSNALNIAELRQTQVSMDLWRYSRGQNPTSQTVSTSLNGFLASIAGDLGVLVNDYQASEDFSTMIVNQLHDLIGQVSGVNLDEELIDLLKYQRGYQAAARVIVAADEMLQTLIEL